MHRVGFCFQLQMENKFKGVDDKSSGNKERKPILLYIDNCQVLPKTIPQILKFVTLIYSPNAILKWQKSLSPDIQKKCLNKNGITLIHSFDELTNTKNINIKAETISKCCFRLQDKIPSILSEPLEKKQLQRESPPCQNVKNRLDATFYSHG